VRRDPLVMVVQRLKPDAEILTGGPDDAHEGLEAR
jgi:hypothetical protein